MREKQGGRDEEARLFQELKQDLPIGIYGSFYLEREVELIALRDFLRSNGYLNVRISRDLDPRSNDDEYVKDALVDRELSEQLIDSSEVHVFVFFMPETKDPGHLNQSVSMELERLYTLMEFGFKHDQDLIILLQNGLRKEIKGCFGSVCLGLLKKIARSYPCDIIDFKRLKSKHNAVFHFCYRCVEKRS